MTNNERQQTENGPQHYLQAYQQVWSIYQTSNDNYFKRTQILMFAMQVAVFAALVKLIGDIDGGNIFPKSPLKLAALWMIPLVGFLSARAWALVIVRQWNLFELYRRYMRYLERVLMTEHGVPMAPFTLEKAVFSKDQNCILFDSCEAGGNPQTGRDEQEYFPDCGERGRMKIRMMRTEEYMAVFLMSFWCACLGTISVYALHRTPHCFWFIPIFIVWWVVAFILWRWVYKPWKKHWGHRRGPTKKFSEFMWNR